MRDVSPDRTEMTPGNVALGALVVLGATGAIWNLAEIGGHGFLATLAVLVFYAAMVVMIVGLGMVAVDRLRR